MAPGPWNGNVYTARNARGSELPKLPSSFYLPHLVLEAEEK